MSVAVELENISKYFGRSHVLKGVNLKLTAGNFYVLLGKNGAGKSTLMRILMRYEQPSQGRGAILGVPLETDRDGVNLEIGYVSESLDFTLPLRLRKLFGYFAEIYPKWDAKLFEGMLSELGIDLNRYFRELSRGQKMQVAFAAAIAIHPKMLLLDEITAVLDANARAFFMEYLGRFTRAGGTVVMATNIVSEVQNFANHMIMLHDGQVSLDLPFADLSGRFLKLRRRPGNRHEIFSQGDCVEVGLNSDGSTSYIVEREKFKASLLGDELQDQRGVTAEEIFIYFTRSRWR